MSPKESANAWLCDKLASIGIGHEGNLHALQTKSWSVTTKPILDKSMAKAAFLKEKEAAKNDRVFLITEEELGQIRDSFGKQTTLDAINLPRNEEDGEQPSWIACCRVAFQALEGNKTIDRWAKQNWQPAEAAVTILHSYGQNITDALIGYNPAGNSMLTSKTTEKQRAQDQAELVRNWFNLLIGTMAPEDQATILFSDELNTWLETCTKSLKLGGLIHVTKGISPANIRTYWQTAYYANALTREWAEESPECYKKLRDMQNEEWATLTKEIHDTGKISYRLSPRQAYELESAIRTGNSLLFHDIIMPWKTSTDIIQFQYELLGNYDGADSRGTGYWEKSHIHGFIQTNLQTGGDNEPEEQLSTPRAADHLDGETAIQEISNFGDPGKNTINFSPNINSGEDWDVSEAACFVQYKNPKLQAIVESREKEFQEIVPEMEGTPWALDQLRAFGDMLFEHQYRIPKGHTNHTKLWWEVTKPGVAKNFVLAATPVTPPSLREYLDAKLTKMAKGMATHAMAALNFELEACGTPTYFLKSQMWQAITATHLPNNLEPETLQFPMDAGIFNLEAGCLSIGEFEFKTLAFAIVEEESVCNLPGAAFLHLSTKNKATRLVTCAIAQNPKGEIICCASDNNIKKTLGEISAENASEKLMRLAEESGKIRNQADLGIKQSDIQDISRMLPGIVIRIGLLMGARPDLVEKPPWFPNENTGPALAQDELWQPNFIGRNYQLKSDNNGTTGGTHDGRSPRYHFRAGHLRDQAHGPKLGLRKLIWIEPTIVGIN